MTALREEAKRLFLKCRAQDIRPFETERDPSRLQGLARQVAADLEAGLALTATVQAHFDGLSAPAATPAPANFGVAIDQLMEAELSTHKVADVAFMVSAELRQRLSRLQGPTPAELWDLVDECGSGIRRLRKSMVALDQAIAESEGLPVQLSDDTELEISIKTRRLYRKLWRFAAETSAGPSPMRPRLRAVGTHIAMLVGRDEYAQLRENDRRQLRGLQARVLQWLAEPDADERAGHRLWEDFAGFAQMLRQVNLRQELAQHDAVVLEIVEKLLERQPPNAEVHSSVRTVLSALVGLDDGLDELVSPEPMAVARARAEVQRVRRRLGGAMATEAASPPGAADELF